MRCRLLRASIVLAPILALMGYVLPSNAGMGIVLDDRTMALVNANPSNNNADP